MDLRHLIATKRDGHSHTEEELRFLAESAARCDLARADGGGVPPYQLSAWLMAAYLKGLSREETVSLTTAMAQSGETLDLTGLPKPWVDKHSTGGVGDKTTIALLPILAASGLTVVKMSGRGLGITGGTVDKLGSIPGFRVDLSPQEMVRQANEIGLALTGQTPNLAPADKVLYALRDTTETVASMPLIVSSILSKKLAGGAEVLGLDVKCGSGAFMKTLAEARALGSELLAVARLCGLDTHVTLSDMDQPLGRTAGNALEVREAFDVLRGNVPSARFFELVLHLAAETLAAVGLADDDAHGLALAREAVSSGRALERAERWIAAQGGDPAVASNPDLLPKAPIVQEVVATRSGHVSRVDAEQVGLAVLELGGGRQRATDTIDPAVGVETLVDVGDWVEAGQPLFIVHAASHDACDAAKSRVHKATSLTEGPVAPRPVVLEVLA